MVKREKKYVKKQAFIVCLEEVKRVWYKERAAKKTCLIIETKVKKETEWR